MFASRFQNIRTNSIIFHNPLPKFNKPQLPTTLNISTPFYKTFHKSSFIIPINKHNKYQVPKPIIYYQKYPHILSQARYCHIPQPEPKQTNESTNTTTVTTNKNTCLTCGKKVNNLITIDKSAIANLTTGSVVKITLKIIVGVTIGVIIGTIIFRLLCYIFACIIIFMLYLMH